MNLFGWTELGRPCFVAKRVVEVVSDRLFCTMVANLSNSSLNIPKYTKVVELTERPALIVDMRDDEGDQNDLFTVICVCKKRVDKETFTGKEEVVSTTGAKSMKATGRIRSIIMIDMTNSAQYLKTWR